MVRVRGVVETYRPMAGRAWLRLARLAAACKTSIVLQRTHRDLRSSVPPRRVARTLAWWEAGANRQLARWGGSPITRGLLR